MACNKYVTHHAKRDLMGIVQSINPGQTVQSAHNFFNRPRSKLFVIGRFSVYQVIILPY